MQAGRRDGNFGTIIHEVSLSAGNLGLESGCGIICPVAQRGQRKTSTPVSLSKHSAQVCGAGSGAGVTGRAPSLWSNERARSMVPSRTCDAEHRHNAELRVMPTPAAMHAPLRAVRAAEALFDAA